MSSELRTLAILLVAHEAVSKVVEADMREPIILSAPERQVMARIFNEIDDDLEVLAESWGLINAFDVRMIDADDEMDEVWGDMLDEWDDEQQEMEDFAQDDDFHNFDHSEML